MANQVEIQITADPKNAQAGFKSTQTAFGKMADGIKRHRKAIGVGLSAIGAGMLQIPLSLAMLIVQHWIEAVSAVPVPLEPPSGDLSMLAAASTATGE